MKPKPLLACAIALALAALACQSLPNLLGSGGGSSTSNALFQDDFSGKSQGWDEASNDNASTGYADGEYFIKVYPTSWFAWANPEGANLSLSNIHIEVTAKNVGSATEPGFGVMCDYTGSGENTYYMGVSVDGYYVIAKTVNSEDTVLSDQSSWVQSGSIPLNADSYKVSADCGNGSLSLAVNGTTLDTVSDSTFTTGTVGLFVQTFAEQNAEVRFDNYVVTALQ